MSRKNIHLSDSVEARANELIKSGVADGLSDLIARLIREEWERRHGIYPIRIPTPDELNERKQKQEATPPAADRSTAPDAAIVSSSKTPAERPAGRTIRRIHARSKETGNT